MDHTHMLETLLKLEVSLIMDVMNFFDFLMEWIYVYLLSLYNRLPAVVNRTNTVFILVDAAKLISACWQRDLAVVNCTTWMAKYNAIHNNN
jgi:hypothetical protein